MAFDWSWVYCICLVYDHDLSCNLIWYWNSIGRKLSAQLRAKIRSLDESYPTSSGSSSSRNLRETAAVTAAAVAAAAATAAAVTATSTYTAAPSSVIHNELHFEDTKSLHSDSSSDITSGEATNPSRSRHTTHDDAKISVNNLMLVNSFKSYFQ